MTDATGPRNPLWSPPKRITPEQDLTSRRRLAGSRGYQPSGGYPTRTTDGEWMWRITLDLPEAMQLELKALATAQGVTADQVVREALVAFGIGNASHVAGICNGSHSDDEERREVDAEMAKFRAAAKARHERGEHHGR